MGILVKARDYQRSKLYQAEEVIRRDSKVFYDLCDVDEYLKEVFVSDFFRTRFSHVTEWNLKDGRRTRFARGGKRGFNGVYLNLPRWSRIEFIVLHELAHGLVEHQYDQCKAVVTQESWKTLLDFEPHGRRFCCIYLELVNVFMSQEAADKLEASFVKTGVQYQPRIEQVLT